MATALRLARPSLLPHWIPDDQYRDAVLAWLHGRDADYAAQILNVPKATVLRLVKTPEWGRMAHTYRKEMAETEAGVLTHLIHKSLKRVAISLEEGDDHVLKNGDIVKKQISGADAARIATLLFERRNQAFRTVDGKEEKTDDSMAQLFAIADQLKQRFIQPPAEALSETHPVIDVTPVAEPAGEAA